MLGATIEVSRLPSTTFGMKVHVGERETFQFFYFSENISTRAISIDGDHWESLA